MTLPKKVDHVPARLVRKGKLKVIDAPLPDITIAEAVDRARQYTRGLNLSRDVECARRSGA
jgi:hypothetical protein